ncbi:enoyl-CoA hydratase [Ferrithrix thermotolerans DSM 19514]|uniref:enoyl-CoA hydratase n=1 Tax=Ferrithrix thermotolerans DSM 19514 TaxID=1121881 RepID=A0A1M4XX24_9ACTN|nr:enoyl-CoA hydratase-related protein [Ferrithrix thermotolerans]SHE97792.1 enoyl-CoA hydratase [Ferrithrix thermotolerans DSM 19514]
MDKYVDVALDDHNVATITLRRPKINALSSDLLIQLAEVAEGFIQSPPGAVVISGGPKIFAAGAEITEFKDPAKALELGRLFHRALGALAAIPRVTVAAVNGYALGGGCELALACDLRVAGEHAKFGQPEILLGIIPGGGGTQRLPRLIGVSRAKEIILSGRQVSAQEALTIGLCNRVVKDEDVEKEAISWARSFASGALVAQGLAKEAIDRGVESSLESGLSVELSAFAQSFSTEDSKIGISSFFENGPGKAVFVGR